MYRSEVHVKFGREAWSEENPCRKKREGVRLTSPTIFSPFLTDFGCMMHLRESFTHTYQKF
jgi:hypothetical protein